MAPIGKRRVSAAAFIIMHALIEKESEKRKRRKQRFWTSHFLRTRRSTQLLTDLQTADSSGLFKKCCRMSQADFDLLISLIGPRISKQDTNYRECIPAEMRLAITLRFLATGDSYSSLMYLFRVSRPLICKIIPKVCACIIEALKEHVKVSTRLLVVTKYQGRLVAVSDKRLHCFH
nr:unnamed protein product [Callosobruchus chinensis]